ncbi:MAG TPA: hypothetical protein VLX89_08390 [Actinomycetota bacterium]|nr:hypothetical protein [Actinomycetota bacterium]
MPVRRRSVFVVVLTAAVLGVALAPAATGAQVRFGRLGIGDSVMLGAKVDLLHHGFRVVDAVESRQFYKIVGIVDHWKRLGRLPKDVVIGLGTNGTVDLPDCYAAVRAAGPDRNVFFVNLKVPRVYRAIDNARLAQCAGHFRNAYLIDWYHHSVGHPGWFYSDGFHLRPSGRQAYATFVSQRIAALT